MMFLKACPKCRGDVVLDKDLYGRYVRCLQCGFLRDTAENDAQFMGRLDPVQESEAA